MEISPNIHRIEVPLGARMMAMHLLVGRRVWLIDTGIADTPVRLEPYLRSIGRGWSDVAGAVVTHCDADHCGGNAMLRRLAPQSVIAAHALDAPLIADPDRCIRERYQFDIPYGAPLPASIAARVRANLGDPSPVDEWLADDALVEAGDEPFTALHCPGHSRGHLVVYDPRERVAVITDAVLGEHIPSADGRPLFAPPYRYLREYLTTIARLRALRLRAMFPTHFPAAIGEREVDAFLDTSERFVHRLSNDIDRAIDKASGPLSLTEIVNIVKPGLSVWVDADEEFLNYSLCHPVAAHLDDAVMQGRLSVNSGPHANRYGDAR